MHNGIARLAGGDTCSAADRVCVSFALHDCCCTSIECRRRKVENRTNVFFLAWMMPVVWPAGSKATPTALQVFFIHAFQYNRKGWRIDSCRNGFQ